MKRPGKRSLRQAVHDCGGVISDLAATFDVSRQTIYDWLNYYNLRSEIHAARHAMREVAQDVIYERLFNADEALRFEAARFVALHLRNDGELLAINPSIIAMLEEMGADPSAVVREFEDLVRARAMQKEQ